MNHIGETIYKKRTELGLTQAQLAAILQTSVDVLVGYQVVAADYDARYTASDYYWGLKPNHLCYEVMQLLPPVRAYRVLDIGCGEGKDTVFLARCGYQVTAFDISEAGIEKAKRLAAYNRVEVRFQRAVLRDYPFDQDYDIIFSSGVLHFLQPQYRAEILSRMREHTVPGGFNALNVFVEKPFIVRDPDSTRDESLRYFWRSGELFTHYQDWLFHTCREDVFDCMSGGNPHKHCMDSLIAQKLEEGTVL